LVASTDSPIAMANRKSGQKMRFLACTHKGLFPNCAIAVILSIHTRA
jgi:hypothetical protein